MAISRPLSTASSPSSHHRSTVLSLLLALCSLLHLTTAGSVSDFSYYPSGAQPCLQSAATSSKCDQSSVPVFNACVCSNGGGFIDSAAKCIGQNSPNDLTTTYTVLQRNCANSNTPLSYPLSQFLAQGSATTAQGTATTKMTTALVTLTHSGSKIVSTSTGLVTTSVAAQQTVSTITIATTNAAGQTTGVLSVVTFAPLQSVTSSAGSSPSTVGSSGSSGLSTGAAVGIGVGIGVPVLLALCALIAVLVWRGKRKTRTGSDADAAAFAGAGAAGAGVAGTGAAAADSHIPEKAYAHEMDSSSAGQSPYTPQHAQPVPATGAAAAAGGAATGNEKSAHGSSPQDSAIPYGSPLPVYAHGQSQQYQQQQYAAPSHSQAVELSGTPVYPQAQELPAGQPPGPPSTHQ